MRSGVNNKGSQGSLHLIEEAPKLLEIAKILLGHDSRFQVMIGGNPNAVHDMLADAQLTVTRASAQ